MNAKPGLINPVLSEETVAETLSAALLSLLERRYLTDFNPGDWVITPRREDSSVPILHEVLELGWSAEKSTLINTMQHILTACHEPGHNLMMLLQGDEKRQRLYFGGKRMMGQANRSTQEYIQGVRSTFSSYHNGLKLGPDNLLNSEPTTSLYDFIQSAPATAILTGIPSYRGSTFSSHYQGIDKIAKAAGRGRYVLSIIAEPLSPGDLDATIDVFQRLRSEIHSLVKLTQSRGQNSARSVAYQERSDQPVLYQQVPSILMGTALFLQGLQLFGGIGNINGLISLMQNTSSMALHSGFGYSNRQSAKSISETTGENKTEGIELLDAHAEACEQLILQYIQRLQVARGSGWWNTGVYLAAEDEQTLSNICSVYRSISNGDQSHLDSFKLIRLPGGMINAGMLKGGLLTIKADQGKQLNPLGEPFNCLSTCINSQELSVVVHLPVNELPGIPMRQYAPFALTIPESIGNGVHLGTVYEDLQKPLNSVEVALTTLNRHVFVSGMPGFGKTNTCMQLLTETYRKHQIPFLVIEPAKTEYRNLIQVDGIREHLRVYTIGSNAGLPLRLNPFEPVEGIPLAKHIDLLKAVFNASFPMFAGMSYVLEEAILELYQERGWSLYTSENYYGGKDLDERAALMPMLTELHDKIDVVLARKKYGDEINKNLGAALRSRIKSLMVGNKGMVLNTRRSSSIADLMKSPTVIELQDLGDDEEKAFVMALVLVLLYEHAEIRQQDLPTDRYETLQHLTLVEEAHRLLSTKGATSSEGGDPKAKAVAMFTDLLAEMRAYGEGFIIADQIPMKLAPEIIKNTNLKIVHRLSSPDDRRLIGASMGLTESQTEFVNSLPTGFAIIHDEQINRAVLGKIASFKETNFNKFSDKELRRKLKENQPSSKIDLFQNAGCHFCSSPCSFLHIVRDRELLHENLEKKMLGFFQRLERNVPDSGWDSWLQFTKVLTSQLSRILIEPANEKGIKFCMTVNTLDAYIKANLEQTRESMNGDPTRIQAITLGQDLLLKETLLKLIGRSVARWISTDQQQINEEELVLLSTAVSSHFNKRKKSTH